MRAVRDVCRDVLLKLSFHYRLFSKPIESEPMAETILDDLQGRYNYIEPITTGVFWSV